MREFLLAEGSGKVFGIGIDAVSIDDIEALIECRRRCDCLTRLFTPSELAESSIRKNPAEHLAGRFAAKEAFFKATSALWSKADFDMRCVETLADEYGRPQIHLPANVEEKAVRAGYENVLVSITNEHGLAIAIVVAQSR